MRVLNWNLWEVGVVEVRWCGLSVFGLCGVVCCFGVVICLVVFCFDIVLGLVLIEVVVLEGVVKDVGVVVIGFCILLVGVGKVECLGVLCLSGGGEIVFVVVVIVVVDLVLDEVLCCFCGLFGF